MADVAATLSTYSCWFSNGNSTCSVFITRLNCAVGERGGSAGGPVRVRGVKRLYVTTFHFLSTWCDDRSKIMVQNVENLKSFLDIFLKIFSLSAL